MTTQTHPRQRRPAETAGQPLVGWALTAVGILHIAATPLFYGSAFRSIADGGVVASVDADAALVDLRSSGFWYVSAGLGMLIVASLVTWIERRTATVPGFLGWALMGFAVWGIVLMPTSGFWAVLLVGLLALWSSRRGSAQPPRVTDEQRHRDERGLTQDS